MYIICISYYGYDINTLILEIKETYVNITSTVGQPNFVVFEVVVRTAL